eukprot:5091483-Heterocapsa_arctica.AAC.1
MNIKNEINKYKKMNQGINNVIRMSKAKVAEIITKRKNNNDFKDIEILMKKKNKNDPKEMDKDMVMEAVKQEGEALQYASMELKGDREAVMEADKSNGEAL